MRFAVFAVLVFAGAVAVQAQQIPQTAPDPGAGSVYRIDALPPTTTRLAAGPGQDKAERYCSMCHSTAYITMQPPLPGKAWATEVKKMMEAYGAPIPSADAAIIVTYLQAHYTPETIARTHPAAPLPAGAKVYADRCSACHQPDLKGLEKYYPPLQPHAFELTTKAHGRPYLAHVVLFGLSGPIAVNGIQYNGTMPSWGSTLADDQIAAVLNYIDPEAKFSTAEIAGWRRDARTPDQVHSERESLSR